MYEYIMTLTVSLLCLGFQVKAYELSSTSYPIITPLKSGIPIRGTLGVDEYHYYKYTNILNNTDVVFSLTGNYSYCMLCF